MICELIQKLCRKKEKIKIKKATVEPAKALSLTKMTEYSKPFVFALNEIGVKEFKGANHNPRIIEYHKACKLKAKTDEISWCSAFMNWCFLQAKEIRTESAAAISWAKWGNDVDKPRVGDVVVFRRVDSDWKGHVGFFVDENKDSILVLGGNQGNEVSFQWYPKRGKKIRFHCFRRS